MAKRKKRILRVIRKSTLTGKAVWVGHIRTYKTEWKAYRTACIKEINRMRQWAHTVNRRKRNVVRLLGELTACLPIIGDIPDEQRAAAKALTLIADNEPPKQSDFYEHIREEKRQRHNAHRREKRWQEKYMNKIDDNQNYDK